MWFWVAGYVLLINFCAFGAFAWDKQRARAGGWRLSERLLLQIALIGGTAGAMAGQQLLRHKTRKEPFRSRLRLVAVCQAIAAGMFVFRRPLMTLVLGGVHTG